MMHDVICLPRTDDYYFSCFHMSCIKVKFQETILKEDVQRAPRVPVKLRCTPLLKSWTSYFMYDFMTPAVITLPRISCLHIWPVMCEWL